jgi:hypothetical protein
MNNGNNDDPTSRRRIDRERMNDRDAEAWKLQRQGWSVRAIARELQMAASSVQRCLQRAQKRVHEELVDGHGHVHGELACEDVTCPDDVAKLDILELFRLRYVPDLAPDVRAAMAIAWAALPV